MCAKDGRGTACSRPPGLCEIVLQRQCPCYLHGWLAGDERSRIDTPGYSVDATPETLQPPEGAGFHNSMLWGVLLTPSRRLRSHVTPPREGMLTRAQAWHPTRRDRGDRRGARRDKAPCFGAQRDRSRECPFVVTARRRVCIANTKRKLVMNLSKSTRYEPAGRIGASQCSALQQRVSWSHKATSDRPPKCRGVHSPKRSTAASSHATASPNSSQRQEGLSLTVGRLLATFDEGFRHVRQGCRAAGRSGSFLRGRGGE